MTQDKKCKYEKPSMKVYEFHGRQQLLAGSPNMPIGPNGTPYQW